MTKLSKFTKFECSPSRLWTLFLGFVPVLEAETPLVKFDDRPLISKGFGEVVPEKYLYYLNEYISYIHVSPILEKIIMKYILL